MTYGFIVLAGFVGTILGYLVSRIFERKPMWKTVKEERQRAEYNVRNIVAVMLVLGFFATIFTIFSGVIDLTDATVAGFVGVIVGHISNKLDPVVRSMFKVKDDDTDASG